MPPITGQFSISMEQTEPLLPGTARFTFTKTWTGQIEGSGEGVMVSAGDPAGGDAGYVALERFEGTMAGRHGTVAFQQFGTMTGGEPTLTYAVVPGSGTGELAGFTGTLELRIDDSGGHHVTLLGE